ncbi:DNA-binding helix-turn-helix protein [Limosilactobacillus coleohominis 101-4-CHN]|uniref:DNA-binding helix-turn-helix protein n=1 Tax=Limosilactobacillus coleohominis 101-4-CHN TaxID=575594 RepID=C7XW59_9LACO|nr:helix-turn-helix domain-containing protein [Limosilactobacillus coleohominis]EEU30119.1 DNA-binding helix-turn-helix protein [Limosilactobacillus coleohominis 101-4-CHN]
MNTNKKPRNRIAELRKEKGLTLQQVADAVSVGNNTISRYETGKREPKLETWMKLANVFDVPVSYIMGTDNINAIRETRILHNTSLGSLAEMTGISEKRLKSIEQFETVPTVQEWFLIAEVLCVPVSEIQGTRKGINNFNLPNENFIKLVNEFDATNEKGEVPNISGSEAHFIGTSIDAYKLLLSNLISLDQKYKTDVYKNFLNTVTTLTTLFAIIPDKGKNETERRKIYKLLTDQLSALIHNIAKTKSGKLLLDINEEPFKTDDKANNSSSKK